MSGPKDLVEEAKHSKNRKFKMKKHFLLVAWLFFLLFVIPPLAAAEEQKAADEAKDETTQINVEALESKIAPLLPENEKFYPDDQVTDKSQRYFAAEFIREKLIKRLGEELPYTTTVTIDSFVEKENIIHIDAIIWVASKGQKTIVIGQKGAGLKAVGEQARKDMERMFENKVFLRTWVKVKDKWMDNELAIKQLGFDS